MDRAALVRHDARRAHSLFLVVSRHDDRPFENVEDVGRVGVVVRFDAPAGAERERLHEHVVGHHELRSHDFSVVGIEVGILIEHTPTTGASDVAVSGARVRDRYTAGTTRRERFTPAARPLGMEHVTVQGTSVPAIGLGTWRMTGPTCRRAVSTALDLGYRRVDTAQAYGNEREVGAAIDVADVDREEVFLTTKLDAGNRDHDAVLDSTRESLDKLRTEYVDLLLIHQPNPIADLEETLGVMDELVDDGAVEHIGVSNFDVERLHRAREHADAPILADQVQYHPFWEQTTLLDYCAINDVMLTAYSPLAHGGAVDDDVLRDIGARYGKTPAQVALRWLVQQENVSTIPKSTSPEHLEANLEVFDFELTDEEMDAIARPSLSRAASSFLRQRLPF